MPVVAWEMPRVLFLQHGPLDLPGLLAEVLAARGAALEIRHPWRGEAVPDSAAGFAGLAFGGGAQSSYEEAEFPYLAREKALLRAARASGTPTLGLCLGAQLMADAFGGEVKPNAQHEVGFFPVEFTPAAARDPLWRDRAALPFTPVHWHGDTFALPPDAVHLASSTRTANQLFACDGRHHGLQFHLEMTAPILDAMIADDLEYLARAGIAPDALRHAAREHFPAVEPGAREVFHRWAELVAER